MQRRHLKTAGFAAIAFVIASFAGCGSTSPEDAVSGTYVLETVNGKALPQTIQATVVATADVLSGQILLTDGGGYQSELRLTYHPASGSPYTATETASGTFVVSPGSVTITSTTGSAATAKHDGQTLLFDGDARSVLLYRRR